MISTTWKLLLGLLPVCLFLISLVYLDSYKLVRFRTLLQLIVSGCLAGVLSYFVNRLESHRRLFGHAKGAAKIQITFGLEAGIA